MTSAIERIERVVAAAKGADDELTAIVEGLRSFATEDSSSKVIFDHNELQIQIGMRGQFVPMVNRLRLIEPLKISPAPTVAGIFSTEECDVLVSRYWACPGDVRVPLGSMPLLPESTRRRFRDDMIKLAEAGYMHAYATRGTSYWRVGRESNVLVLEDWLVLQAIEDNAHVIAMLSSLTGVS